ncbi:MAG: hypothetical protein K2X48_09425 [Chitinophagaceae bacterium]|nr:hypothetical protein [Chitinophagaceae bacterium]
MQVHTEAGLSVVTRSGIIIIINNKTVVKEINYAAFFLESGINYRLNNKWMLHTSFSYVPGSKKLN